MDPMGMSDGIYPRDLPLISRMKPPQGTRRLGPVLSRRWVAMEFSAPCALKPVDLQRIFPYFRSWNCWVKWEIQDPKMEVR